MSFDTIRIDVKRHVALVTVDRPPANLLSPELQAELTRAFDAFTDRADVRAVILTGAGNVFCGGLDIRRRVEEVPAPGDRWAQRRSWRECTYAIMECRKPVVAALNGPALGAGLALAASCDILVAASTAEIGLPEINLGLLGGARRAMRLFGHSRLRRLSLTGQRIGAAELYRLGIVEACLPAEELLPFCRAICEDIAAKSPRAIGLAKLTLNTIENMGLRDGYRFEQDMTEELSGHPEAREAMRAFVEKRAPDFGEPDT